MIDSVKLHLDVAECGGKDLMGTASLLPDCHPTIDEVTGERKFSGHLGNLRVWGNSGSVNVEGSIARFYLGNNAHIPTRHDIEEAITLLSDKLELPMGKADVWRLDVSYHWIMNRAISEYLQRLNSLRYFARKQVTPSSLYFDKGGATNAKNTTNTLLFYNKSKQLHDTHSETPDAYDDARLLRYECRWLKRLPKQFGVNTLTAATLYERPFYCDMVKRWGQYYFAIQKSRETALEFEGVSTPKQGREWILGYCLNRLPAQEIENILQTMRERGIYTDAKYYSRLKSELTKCRLQVKQDIGEDIMTELDNNVRNVLIYCR